MEDELNHSSLKSTKEAAVSSGNGRQEKVMKVQRYGGYLIGIHWRPAEKEKREKGSWISRSAGCNVRQAEGKERRWRNKNRKKHGSNTHFNNEIDYAGCIFRPLTSILIPEPNVTQFNANFSISLRVAGRPSFIILQTRSVILTFPTLRMVRMSWRWRLNLPILH